MGYALKAHPEMESVVAALTDGSGELAAYYEYDAWGNIMTEAETSGVDNPYRYSTKEWDENSGLYYFGARYYSPEIGRWTQRDPAGTLDRAKAPMVPLQGVSRASSSSEE